MHDRGAAQRTRRVDIRLHPVQNLRWDGRRPGIRRVPPRLGEHSTDVLTWLGYTLDDVRSLQSQRLVQ